MILNGAHNEKLNIWSKALWSSYWLNKDVHIGSMMFILAQNYLSWLTKFFLFVLIQEAKEMRYQANITYTALIPNCSFNWLHVPIYLVLVVVKDETSWITTRGPNVIWFNVKLFYLFPKSTTPKYKKSLIIYILCICLTLGELWGAQFIQMVWCYNIEPNYVRASCHYSNCLIHILPNVSTSLI